MAAKQPAGTAGTAVAKAKVSLPANVSAKLAAQAAAIQSRIGAPASNRIAVTQKKTFKTPDGQEGPGPIHGVIVDFVSLNAYYPNGFDPDDIEPPACFAIGLEPTTLVPHEASQDRQCDTCAACPMNQFGSASRGKGKACSNNRMLAILPPDADSDTPLQTLKVSATALRAFDGYVASVARSFSMPPLFVVTEISLDENSDYPSLRFGDPQPNQSLELACDRQDEARTMLTTPKDNWIAPPVEKPAKKASARRGR